MFRARVSIIRQPVKAFDVGVWVGLAKRDQVARARTPCRWCGETCKWTPIGAVTLNPERDAVVPINRNDIQVAA